MVDDTQRAMPDAWLVNAARSGDQGAFDALYERYAARLGDFVGRQLGDRDEASDVVQDAFLIASQRLDQLDDPGRFRSWLYVIASREAVRRLRAKARAVPVAEVADIRDLAATPEEGALVSGRLEMLLAAADGLESSDRALIELYLRGLEGQEMAEAVGRQASAVHVQFHRAKKRLKHSLDAMLVAGYGRRACPELSSLLDGWDGRLNPLIRKRVVRHIEQCDNCDARRRRLVSPEALLGLVPFLAAPADARERLLDDLQLVSAKADAVRAAEAAGMAPSGPAPYAGPGRNGRAHQKGDRRLHVGAAIVAVLVVIAAVLGMQPPSWLVGGGGVHPTVRAAAPETTVAPGAAGTQEPGSSVAPDRGTSGGGRVRPATPSPAGHTTGARVRPADPPGLDPPVVDPPPLDPPEQDPPAGPGTDPAPVLPPLPPLVPIPPVPVPPPPAPPAPVPPTTAELPQARSIHLGPAPAKADIVLAIDTTDTMRSVLIQAKAEATRLLAQIKALIPGARFAVMDFRDYDFGSGGTYPYQLRTDGLTGDVGVVQAAINGMNNGTGGSRNQPRDPSPPQPEAYNRVLHEAVAEAKLAARGPVLGGYDPDAERFLVVLGDEVPRDVPRPARDARFGACPTSAVVDPGPNGVPEQGLGDDLRTEDVIDGLTRTRQTLLMINYKGTYLNCYKQLAQPTGGDGFEGSEAVQVGARIVNAITVAAGLINRVDLVPQTGCPQIRFDPAGPYGPIQTRTTPNLAVTARMTVPRDGKVHTCNVVVVADGARRSVETFRVTAPAAARAAPPPSP